MREISSGLSSFWQSWWGTIISPRKTLQELSRAGLNAASYIVEPGEFEVQVGTSSADIRLRASINVTGTVHTLGREWRMESRCEVER